MVSRRTVIASGMSMAAAGGLTYGVWPRLDDYRDTLERQRRALSDDPTLRDLIRFSTLAANGHNTQPWKYRVREAAITILPDLSRRTPVVDPDDHHLFVSLGCATENFVIASSVHGRPAEVSFLSGPEPGMTIATGKGRRRDDPLYETIPHRQSTRSAFDGQAVSPEDIRRLTLAAQQEGVSVLVFTEPAQRDAISEFVVAGNTAQMLDPDFVSELRVWLRFSPARAVSTGDGLFAPCSGNPALPEWLGTRLFNTVFTQDAETAKYRDHIKSSAGIAVFVGDHADPWHWMQVGRSFERFALQGTALGIKNAHINQPIEVPEVRAEFARWLGMPDARPDLVVRFGRAPSLPMSLRRPVETVLV